MNFCRNNIVQWIFMLLIATQMVNASSCVMSKFHVFFRRARRQKFYFQFFVLFVFYWLMFCIHLLKERRHKTAACSNFSLVPNIFSSTTLIEIECDRSHLVVFSSEIFIVWFAWEICLQMKILALNEATTIWHQIYGQQRAHSRSWI